MDLTSSDLELVQEATTQIVGMRFLNVTIPPGRTIDVAYIQFAVDEVSSGTVNLRLEGHKVLVPPTFGTATNNISSRTPRTTAFTNWSPPNWPTIDAAGADQRTQSLVGVIQELVSQPGWASGNPIAIIVSGTGKRVARAWNGQANAAPLLHVEYH
jgi:hypothetical protein